MKTFIVACLIFCIGVVVGCVLSEHNSVMASIPKTPPRIEVRFIVTPCPKEWEGTPLCNWWNGYQLKEERRWRQLKAELNRGFSLTFEGVRGTP